MKIVHKYFSLNLFLLFFFSCKTAVENNSKPAAIEDASHEHITLIYEKYYEFDELPSSLQKICRFHQYNTVTLNVSALEEFTKIDEKTLANFKIYPLLPTQFISHPSIYTIYIDENETYFIEVSTCYIRSKIYGPGSLKNIK